MLRTIVITLLNIALPFLIRGAFIFIMRLRANRQQQKGIKDVTPPPWHFPVKKLVLIGLLLAVATIAVQRFAFTETDQPYVGNIAKSEILN